MCTVRVCQSMGLTGIMNLRTESKGITYWSMTPRRRTFGLALMIMKSAAQVVVSHTARVSFPGGYFKSTPIQCCRRILQIHNKNSEVRMDTLNQITVLYSLHEICSWLEYAICGLQIPRGCSHSDMK
jgi:hypothetical protein